MKKQTKSEVVAQSIIEAANKYGWVVEVRGDILTIKKFIKPNDNESFCIADGEYWSILSLLPSTSAGSVYGTDGSGIGALSAMNGGTFKMNKTGGSIRVLKALAKMVK